MTVYISAHYNISQFRDSLTRDHIERYRQMLDWFATEPEFKGTISLNSLFLQSAYWSDPSIIKDISKLCLANQIEISSSMFSNYVPLEIEKQENSLIFQVKEAIKTIKKIYSYKYIKGFYRIIFFF